MANGILVKEPPERIVLSGKCPNVVESTSKIFDFPSGWNAANTYVVTTRIYYANQVYLNDPRVLILFESGVISMYIFSTVSAFQNCDLELLIEKRP